MPNPCGNIKFKGDGMCDDDNNNAGCDFDGGDCTCYTLTYMIYIVDI